MDALEDPFQYALMQTQILRLPKQMLATFGTTSIKYFIITEPIYEEFTEKGQETVVREGQVTAQRPQIITPAYLLNVFQGFEHGQEFARYLAGNYGTNEPGLLYQYRNEPGEMTIVSEPILTVADRLRRDIETSGNNLTALIKGVDQLWDISLMKFIYDLTIKSAAGNVGDLASRGLLDLDHQGIPRSARENIERLFNSAINGDADPAELKSELDRWGIFEDYEDRFLNLFRRRR